MWHVYGEFVSIVTVVGDTELGDHLGEREYVRYLLGVEPTVPYPGRSPTKLVVLMPPVENILRVYPTRQMLASNFG